MNTYRTFAIDQSGHFTGADVLEAEDDVAVIQTADRLRHGERVEIWQGARCVAKIEVGNHQLKRA